MIEEKRGTVEKERGFSMTIRENVKAVLNYQPFDHLPVVMFGYWPETLQKWIAEGHLAPEDAAAIADGSPADQAVQKKLGFDFNWQPPCGPANSLFPAFEPRVVEDRPDGSQIVFTAEGVLEMVKPGIVSIPVEVGHTLTDRASWEKEYLPRLQFQMERIPVELFKNLAETSAERDIPLGLHCGSLMGNIRNWMGVEGLSYLYADDPDLYAEIVDTVGNLCYKVAEASLDICPHFDYIHFWEDICFKNGPLVIPSVFEELVGPHYKRIAGLAASRGVTIASLDCDGCIDRLVPIWLENGINTMFPIEVGTWNASIAPWRKQYGQVIRGVGGMNKNVFAYDYAAVDKEIERLRPLIELGGFIPCPDHRIPPDAKFEVVQYYCDKMQNLRF